MTMIKLANLFIDVNDFNNYLIDNKPLFASILDEEIKDLGTIFYNYYQEKIISDNNSDRWLNDLLINFYDKAEYYRYFINKTLISDKNIDAIGDFTFSGAQKTENNQLKDPNFYDNFNFKKANISTRIDLLKKGAPNQMKNFINEFYFFFIRNDSF